MTGVFSNHRRFDTPHSSPVSDIFNFKFRMLFKRLENGLVIMKRRSADGNVIHFTDTVQKCFACNIGMISDIDVRLLGDQHLSYLKKNV